MSTIGSEADVLLDEILARLTKLVQLEAWDHVGCLEDNVATVQLERELEEAEHGS